MEGTLGRVGLTQTKYQLGSTGASSVLLPDLGTSHACVLFVRFIKLYICDAHSFWYAFILQ